MKRHICQGTKCHTYDTKSRVRGTKGNKVLRTRNARFDLNVNRDWIRNWEHYFCDERCMNDWLDVHMVQLINYVGIKNIPNETPAVFCNSFSLTSKPNAPQRSIASFTYL